MIGPVRSSGAMVVCMHMPMRKFFRQTRDVSRTAARLAHQ
jgi:hypothetical protein